jgi:hypothetical protein
MYKALLSTDWNQCLAPCGPFDALAFHYPHHAAALETIFRQYTGNAISLGQAARKIKDLFPAGLGPDQMDLYLDQKFCTYRGVADLMTWCREHQVLFMLNTTGMIGYFQRVLARHLLPPIPVLSAHPLVRFDSLSSDPTQILVLKETSDKAVNTAAVARLHGIEPGKIFLMGDSGGDGPHFEWGARIGALLIGSMIKPSLRNYCHNRDIPIRIQFGISYADGDRRNKQKEMQINFKDLVPLIEDFLV